MIGVWGQDVVRHWPRDDNESHMRGRCVLIHTIGVRVSASAHVNEEMHTTTYGK